MIVIGADTHKSTRTIAAVEAARPVCWKKRTAAARPAGFGELLLWARAKTPPGSGHPGLPARLWWSERFLIARGERVVRVAPKMMARARTSRVSAASPTASTRSLSRERRSPKVQSACLSPPRRCRARSGCWSMTAAAGLAAHGIGQRPALEPGRPLAELEIRCQPQQRSVAGQDRRPAGASQAGRPGEGRSRRAASHPRADPHD